MAAADNNGKGGQGQWRMTMACEIGQQTTKGKDKSGRRDTAETRSGNEGYGSRRWRWWMSMAADNDDGDGRR